MPGTYAHITMANELPHALRRAGGPQEVYAAALAHLKYCELGAISPDYPYMVIGDAHAQRWADIMHRTSTGALLEAGIAHVAGMGGEAKPKAMAWLLGYASHVVADMTVHPVVELKVGPYVGHEKAHRICEMNQDVYIFQKRTSLTLRWAEHFKHGIGTCGDDGLDPDIRAVWSEMLSRVEPEEYRANPPDFDRWQRACRLIVDGVIEDGDRLIPLARHVAVGQGLVYPREGEVDRTYLVDLDTPAGRMDYDQVFDRAIANVGAESGRIASAFLGEGGERKTLLATAGPWDLDTGRIGSGGRVFWEGGLA